MRSLFSFAAVVAVVVVASCSECGGPVNEATCADSASCGDTPENPLVCVDDRCQRVDCDADDDCPADAVCVDARCVAEGEGEGEGGEGEGEGEGEEGEGEEGEGEEEEGEGEGEGEGDVRPDGQCGVDADCASGTCNRNLPGGSCTCGDDGDCNASSSCSDFGTCIGDCDVDGDCPAGLRCLGSGRCAAVACDVDGDCDPRFVCDQGLGQCARAECGASCPDGTSCVQGLCIEG